MTFPYFLEKFQKTSPKLKKKFGIPSFWNGISLILGWHSPTPNYCLDESEKENK